MNKEQFARTPKGTVFCQYTPDILDENLYVKANYSESDGHPYFNCVIPLCPFFSRDSDDIYDGYDGEPSETTPYLTDCFSTDGALWDYNDDQLFAVFSNDEVRRMIDVLTYALCGCNGRCYTNDDEMVMR